MTYIDGFILSVKKSRLKDYIKMAKTAGKIWMKHGALEYKECVGDDINPKVMKDHKMFIFPEMAKTKNDEVTLFSYIVFKSKAHRDKVNKKVMEDPMMDNDEWKNKPMPFDMKRMAYGGFKTIVEL